MVKSPSKFLSRKFLKELRANNYISPLGREYSPVEVDELYFEKSNNLCNKEANNLFKNRTSTEGI